MLRLGGRLMMSDIVLTRPATPAEKKDMALLTGCVSGSLPVEYYAAKVRAAGFEGVETQVEAPAADGELWFSAAIPPL